MLRKRILLLSCCLAMLVPGWAFAAPSARQSGDGFMIKEGVTDEIMAQIAAEKGKIKSNHLIFRMEKVTDADVQKICAAYPDMTGIMIEKSKAVTTLAPLAALKKLQRVKLDDLTASDLSPLAGAVEMRDFEVTTAFSSPDLKWMSGMTKLTRLVLNNRSGGSLTSLEGLPSMPGITTGTFTGEGMKPADLTPLVTAMPKLKVLKFTNAIMPDLTPLGKLADLADLDFYGANVKDFSPLAACANLKTLMYYAVKGADFSTLGALTQIVELKGGLTTLADISWVSKLPNLKKFDVFAEHVTDYSPLAQTNIEEFRIWNMRKPVGDLGFLGGMKSLKKLTFWTVDGVSNFKPLSTLANLEHIEFREVNAKSGDPIDLANLAALPALNRLEITKSKLSNTAALASAKQLKTMKLAEAIVDGSIIIDYGFVGKMPALTVLELNKNEVRNLEGLAASTTLERLTLRDMVGITSLDPLKKMPALKQVSGIKGKFPEDQVAGFPSTVRVN